MTPWESLGIALRALKANTLRSALTMLGIVIGVAAVITMVAVGAGAQQQIAEQIRSLGANLLLVVPGEEREGGARLASGSRHTLTEEDAAAIRAEINQVSAVSPVVSGVAQVVLGNRNWSTTLGGVAPDYLIAREWPLQAGRIFTTEESETGAKVALVGATVVKEVFAGIDPIGQVLRIDRVPFNVIGVLGEKGQSISGTDQDDVVLVPIRAAKGRILGGAHEADRRAVGYIVAKVTRPKSLNEAQQQIVHLLRQRHQVGSGERADFEVRNLTAITGAREEASRTLTFQLAAIASVSLIVGGISIMNIMLVSVTERTREIGLRLALGARRKDVRDQFLIEAVTLSVLGGLAGIALGVAAATLMARWGAWPMLVSPQAMLLAVGFAGAVGIFFGLYPALKASRLDPIEALRFE